MQALSHFSANAAVLYIQKLCVCMRKKYAGPARQCNTFRTPSCDDRRQSSGSHLAHAPLSIVRTNVLSDNNNKGREYAYYLLVEI